jgi:putative transposase
MQDTAKVPGKREDGRPAPKPLVDEELADQLLGKAQEQGVELLGPDGLLSQATKAVLERALAEEMTGHLGYEKHDPGGVHARTSSPPPQKRAQRHARNTRTVTPQNITNT